MKQIFKTLVLVAAAVATLTSCEKAPEVTPAPEEFTLTVNATLPAPDGTKTYLGDKVGTEYPVLWSADDAVKVYELSYVDGVSDVIHNAVSTSTELSADSKTATFKGLSLTDKTPSANADEFDYLALYGNTTNNPREKYEDPHKSWTLKIPNQQAPTDANQFDSAAALMVAYDSENPTRPSTLDLTFKHVGAYAMLNIKGLDCGDEDIKSVSIETSKEISGNIWYYYLTNTTTKASSSTSTSIIVDMSKQPIANKRDFNVCFVATPTVFEADDVLTFKVTTDANTYTKEVTVTEDFSFVQGEILQFSANFATITADVIEGTNFELVTDVTKLDTGDEIILVAVLNDVYYAAGKFASNKLSGTSVIWKNNVITVQDGDEVDVFKLTNTDNKWMFESSRQTPASILNWKSSTDFKFTDPETASTEYAYWTITNAGTNQFDIVNLASTSTSTTRQILYQFSGTRFAPYGESNASKTAEYSRPYIYKKVTE